MDTQTEILILQLFVTAVGTAIAVGASIWVARKYGENAATKYLMTEEKRTAHQSICVEQLSGISMLPQGLRDPNDVLIVGYAMSVVAVPRIGGLFKGYGPSLMKEHLVTGYPELWKSFQRYEEEYNGLAGETEAIYKEVLGSLSNTLSADEDKLQSKLEGVVAAFAGQVYSVLVVGNQELWFMGDPNTLSVSVVGTQVLKADSDKEMRDTIQQLDGLVKPYVERLRAKLPELVPLKKRRETILSEMDQIQTDVKHGVPLNGWCQTGLKGGYELKA